MDRELQISTWDQFVGIADKLDTGPPTSTAYAFRGHANASWGLTPTLLRATGKMGLSQEKVLKMEGQCLAEFKSQAHLHIAPNTLKTTTDTISWWTLMQHHGAPTRLLDWCKSIYVAAYFATIGLSNSPGAIWFVHISAVDQFMKSHYDETDIPSDETGIAKRFLERDAPKSLVFCERLNKTDRMVAQQGLFCIGRNMLADHGSILEDVFTEQTEQDLFRKIIIPSNVKGHFIRKLRSMNITGSSLFPGLDGLGRSVAELIRAHE